MKKWLMVVVVAAAGGYLAYTQRDTLREKLWPAKDQARLMTAPVIQTNINFAVNAAGEISPAEQVSVRPEINGKINKLPVDVGDRMKQGELLFALDDKELRNQYESSQTDVARAKLELEQADRNYRRAGELRNAELISLELFEQTKTTFELARNALERAQKDLDVIKERLDKTEVRAPFNCTVLTRPVSIGQAVSGSGGFNSGTEVLSIADLNSMVVNAHVNQADVPRLSVGQWVEVSVEAVAGLKATGQVERIAPQAAIKNNIKGFAARILLKNVDQRVRPGMTANVKIPVQSADNVLAVPLAAVFTERNPETAVQERYVYVQKGDGFEKRAIETGVADFFFAEVQRGLSPGEVVALELPKEEREKQAKSLAGIRAAGAELATTTPRVPGGSGTTSTNIAAARPRNRTARGRPRPAGRSGWGAAGGNQAGRDRHSQWNRPVTGGG